MRETENFLRSQELSHRNKRGLEKAMAKKNHKKYGDPRKNSKNISTSKYMRGQERAYTSFDEWTEEVLKKSEGKVVNIYNGMRAHFTEDLVEFAVGDKYIIDKEDIYRALRALDDDELDQLAYYVYKDSPVNSYVDFITYVDIDKNRTFCFNKVSTMVSPMTREQYNCRSIVLVKDGRDIKPMMTSRAPSLGFKSAAEILCEKKVGLFAKIA